MSATMTSAARALAIGFVLSVAGSAPAWSQSLIGDGSSVDSYSGYQRGEPAVYGYAPAPYAYAPETARSHRHHR